MLSVNDCFVNFYTLVITLLGAKSKKYFFVCKLRYQGSFQKVLCLSIFHYIFYTGINPYNWYHVMQFNLSYVTWAGNKHCQVIFPWLREILQKRINIYTDSIKRLWNILIPYIYQQARCNTRSIFLNGVFTALNSVFLFLDQLPYQG